MCGRIRTFGRFGKRELIGNVITSHIKSLIWDRATTTWCNAANASKVRVEYKVHRLAECNKNKIKTNEERWHVTPYDWGGGRVDSVDGFVGWVDTGIDSWCDWHQRTINRAYHFYIIAKPANT